MANLLKEIVTKLKEARATAGIALDSVDPKNRSGVEGRVRQAEREIVELEQAYRDEIVNRLLVVGIRGEKSKEFADSVSDSMLCVDQNLVTNLITDGISSRLEHYYGFGGQELNALMGELNEIRANYGIFSIPPIQDNGISALVASLPLRAAVEKVVRTNYGKQIHSAVIRRHAADLALSKLYDGNGKLVVGVYNFDGLDPLILPEASATVDVSGEINEETVGKLLGEIRQKLAGGSRQSKPRGKAANKESQNGQQ